MGIRGNPSYTPPEWCIDQAEALTDDIMSHADTNHDGVLDEAEFSRHVAPLLYGEMRSQGFAAPKAADTAGGKVDDWQGGTPCSFNELLRKCQLDDVGQQHRRYRRRAFEKPNESNWSPNAAGAIEAERRERARLDQATGRGARDPRPADTT
jgi:hypothetical protein